MPESTLLIDKSEGIATLTLNRPEAMNALSRTLRSEIVQAFTSLQHDPEVGVIILTGAGRAFCAGMDLKELGSTNTTLNNDTVGGELDIIQATRSFDRPITGAINGLATSSRLARPVACATQ